MKFRVAGKTGEAVIDCRKGKTTAIHLKDERGGEVCFSLSEREIRKWAELLWPFPHIQEPVKITDGILSAEISMSPRELTITASNVLAGPPVEVTFEPYRAAELSLSLAYGRKITV